MKELFQYKYLSLEHDILERQRDDALKQFKIDYKEYILEPQKPPKKQKADDDLVIDKEHLEDENDGSDNKSDKIIDSNIDNNNDDKIRENDSDSDDNHSYDNDSHDNDNKNNDNKDKISIKKRKKHRKNKSIPIEPKTIEDKVILKIYRKLSKILHPDKNPLCVDIFLKLKKHYDEKNIMELILMAKTFEISDSDLSLDVLDLDIYKKEINNMNAKIKAIKENMIWLLYYGDENQKLTIRRNLLAKLNKK